MIEVSIYNPSSYRAILYYSCWWLFWTIFQAVLLFRIGFSIQVALTDSIATQIIITLAGYIMGNVLRFYQPGNRNSIYVIVWCIGITALDIHVLNWGLMELFKTDLLYVDFLNKSMIFRFAFSLLMIFFITNMVWMFHYMKGVRETEIRQENAAKLAKEAELATLRQQLQPHFLFNSLNSINALIGSKPEEARKMIQQLSDFFRGTIKKDHNQDVSLREELTHLELYLNIEKVRFGHRLNTLIKADENTLDVKIPGLLLQPVVENAIKFGLYDTVGEVLIKVSAYLEDKNLYIKIENPFDPVTSSNATGTGFGLSSIQRRLYLVYARHDLLTTKQEGNLFITTIKIPL